jgi:hypothetical protein
LALQGASLLVETKAEAVMADLKANNVSAAQYAAQLSEVLNVPEPIE